MPKPVEVHKGVLKEFGPAISEVEGDIGSCTYSYIQFADGTMLRNVVVMGGLDGKLDGALESKQAVELHVQPGMKKNRLLLALRVGDQLYASETSGSLLFLYVVMAVLILLGWLPSGSSASDCCSSRSRSIPGSASAWCARPRGTFAACMEPSCCDNPSACPLAVSG